MKPMEIKTTTATKIVLTGLMESHGLDPLCIFLEDYPRRSDSCCGKVTVECYGKAWSNYWPAMGDQTVAEFFTTCDADYVAKKFGHVKTRIYDWDAISDQLTQRTGAEVYVNNDVELADYRSELEGMWGDTWWDEVPMAPCPDYVYLCKIITAAQEGVKLWMELPKPETMEVPTDFIGVVAEMRAAQRTYFKTRDQVQLAKSKVLEKGCDQHLDLLKNPGLF